GDEVGAHEPREPVVDPARGEQLLPAPGHRPDRKHHDREREEEVADAGVRQDVPDPPDIDLPDDVRGAEAGNDERRRDPEGTPPQVSDNLGIRRTEAYALGRARRPLESLFAGGPGRKDGAGAVGAAVGAHPADASDRRRVLESVGLSVAGEEADAG